MIEPRSLQSIVIVRPIDSFESFGFFTVSAVVINLVDTVIV